MNLHYPGQTTLTSLVPRILGALAEHSFFWELFCGTCQVFKRKNPVPSILIDKNAEIVNAALTGLVYPVPYEFIQADVFEVLEEMIRTGGFAGRVLGPNHLVYLDPPWRVSSRGESSKELYKFEVTDGDLTRLLSLVRLLPCRVALLHYEDSFFDERLYGWHKLKTRVSYRGRVCTVALYCNYDFRAVRAHIPEKAGINRTDRQRIKRKVERWVKNFETLPIYEQQAIFEALRRKHV